MALISLRVGLLVGVIGSLLLAVSSGRPAANEPVAVWISTGSPILHRIVKFIFGAGTPPAAA